MANETASVPKADSTSEPSTVQLHKIEPQTSSAEDSNATTNLPIVQQQIHEKDQGHEEAGEHEGKVTDADTPTAPAFSSVKGNVLSDLSGGSIVPTGHALHGLKIDDESHLVPPARDTGQRPKGANEAGSDAEIQSIIEQFGDGSKDDASDDVKSPTGSNFPVFHYPPRNSSLSNASTSGPAIDKPRKASEDDKSTKVSRIPSSGSEPERTSVYASSIAAQSLPPAPDPEPDLPFDFQRFLEQLRHRTADPVAKFLRSFLMEFGKKQWLVHEQVKIISDFLTFISNRMAQCDVWRTVSDAEFDNAKEGMEKLVMNRLYTQTFSPEIPVVESPPGKGKRKGSSTLLTPGRRGQHLEDTERDELLAQKVRIYGWIREEHLDIKPFTEKGRKFLALAQKELSKIKSYRAPRDKVICVLNCCKVIFGFLRNAQSDQSADAFIPILIYTVLRANPDHLVSNVQYILRFRNQDKLTGEAGYYMSSLMGAVQFIENLDRTNLTVSDEEFEKNVEAAVSQIAEPHEKEEKRAPSHPQFNEKSAPSRPEVTARHSMEGEKSISRRSGQRPDSNSGDESDEGAAVAGLLRSIQKPLSTIGRIFSEEPSVSSPSNERPPITPARRVSPNTSGVPNVPPKSPSTLAPGVVAGAAGAEDTSQRNAQQDAAARQASAEVAEAQRITQAEHKTVVDTLLGMFPELDPDVISDVVRMKEGRIGLAVDACLALSR